MGSELVLPRSRAVFVAVACLVGWALAGCQTNTAGTVTAAPNAALTPPPAEQTELALAFEPVVGIPADRATVLATELGVGAAQAKLPIIGRNQPGVEYRIKGYFSAMHEGTSTRVNYIWDLFAEDGARVHRITGNETIPAALPDPWSAVPDETLKHIARKTITGLRDWIDQGAPTTAVAGDPMPAGAVTALAPLNQNPLNQDPIGESGAAGTRAGITDTRLIATGRAGRIPDDAAASMRETAVVRTQQAPRQPAARFTYYLDAVTGATGDGSQALAASLSEQLRLAGGARISDRAKADYTITGEATIAPPVKGRQIVAIIWAVADRSGAELGSVRQIARVSEGQLKKRWGASAHTAAASAAPGVLALIPE